MMLLLILLVELFLLYLISKKVRRNLFILFFDTSKSRTVAISALSLLLYPGVVLHELSHVLVSLLLFVPIKSITLVPKITESTIISGTVIIRKVDPFRRMLVGVSPIFAGVFSLWVISTYLLIPSFIPHAEYQIFSVLLALILIFSISSTMFSSKKDLKAAVYTLPLVLLVAFLGYFMKFQVQRIAEIISNLAHGLWQIDTALLIALAIQVGVSLITQQKSKRTLSD